MAKVKLTAGRIADHVCPEGKSQAFLWCNVVPGLAVRVSPKVADNSKRHRKSYIFQATLEGQKLRVTIGDVTAWSIEDAQAEARRLQILVDNGQDPRQVKADAKEAKAAAIREKAAAAARELVTLSDVWPKYIAARKHKWSERHVADHENIARPAGDKMKRGKGMTKAAPLVSLLDTKLSDLTAERIAVWLDKETQTRPTSTALAFRLLRGCLNWCESEKTLAGLVPSGAMKSPKVRDAVPDKTVKDDCLQREQLPLWFEHVRKLGNPVHSAYLQALLITGARREELAGLRWQDVDFQWNSITIRDKVEGERVIPLTPYVSALLAALPRRNGWVFSSPAAKSGRLMEPRIGHNRALTAAGLPALTLHGLRRSFGTLSEWCEVPTGVVAQIMGHKPSAIAEKHYRRRPLDLLRMWHTKIEAWILEQAVVAFVPAEPGLRAVK